MALAQKGFEKIVRLPTPKEIQEIRRLTDAYPKLNYPLHYHYGYFSADWGRLEKAEPGTYESAREVIEGLSQLPFFKDDRSSGSLTLACLYKQLNGIFVYPSLTVDNALVEQFKYFIMVGKSYREIEKIYGNGSLVTLDKIERTFPALYEMGLSNYLNATTYPHQRRALTLEKVAMDLSVYMHERRVFDDAVDYKKRFDENFFELMKQYKAALLIRRVEGERTDNPIRKG